MAIEDVATKVENNGDGTCTWRVNFNMTIDEQMVADMKRQMFAQMSAKAVALPISRAHGYIDNEVDAGRLDGFTRGGCVKVNSPGSAALLDPSDTTHETLSADEPMDLLELQRRCNASSSRLDDGSATFAHIRAQRAQADLVASIRSEWDNLPDAEPAGILKR